MFFDWKIQLEKVQLIRDLKVDTILYQGIRLPCKNDQEYCDPTTFFLQNLYFSTKLTVSELNQTQRKIDI